MKNPKNQPETLEQGLEYWTNEYEYFMDAIEGLKMSHAIVYAMAEHAKKKMQELTEEKED